MKKNKKTVPSKTKKNDKGKDTRQMILNAARIVFARHSYNAASIRMIAAQGEFYHGLIRYHFPSKASIFEAVIKESCQILSHEHKIWLKEASVRDREKGLSIFMDRFIEFSKKHPEICRIIIQNISHDEPSTLPGYQHLKELLTSSRKNFKEITNLSIPSDDIVKFLTSLDALNFYYLGAKPMAADIVDMDPESAKYLKWVKDTLIFIFLPVLNQYLLKGKK